jgi:hypothetical protein
MCRRNAGIVRPQLKGGRMNGEHKQDGTTPSRLVKDKVLAPMIGVSVSWLQKDRIGAKLIPFVRLGDLCLYDVDDAFAAIKARSVGGANGGGRRGRGRA